MSHRNHASDTFKTLIQLMQDEFNVSLNIRQLTRHFSTETSVLQAVNFTCKTVSIFANNIHSEISHKALTLTNISQFHW